MFRVPCAEIRRERKRRGWTQDQLADEMSSRRWADVGDDEFSFTFQHIGRLELGRAAVAFGDDREPLWWALVALSIDPTVIVPQTSEARRGIA